ncbi:hypothetical protein F5Y13DRAFT_183156 [Hypoxylon sp. FL1857]|nr:hypothetical protein F5Y13DRAFT_183156 [Hypoxylon sp. FL1857]
MRSRPLVPECKGIEGVKGKVGTKWYSAKSNMIPGFVSCEACYEDYILTNRFSTNFEPSKPQPALDTWACDIAAKARLSMQSCPQRNKALTFGRLVLCSGCYCDQVIHTGEEANWEVAESFTKSFDEDVRCGMGIFSIRVAMSRTHDAKDFGLFWTAVRKLSDEKFCDDDGIEEGVWYTLPSNPRGFGICAGCYFFMRKRDVQPISVKWRCCFSVAHPRFRQFMQKLLEMYYTLDPTSFDKFATVYTSMHMDCTICPECYTDFVRHSPLAAIMGLDNTLLEASTMCEMYSPRMRKLYKECSETSPPDAGPLLTYSAQRRLVWTNSMPQMRMMLFRVQMALNQQQLLNVTSSYYNQAGMLQEITHGSTHTYGAVGVGYGYANMDLLQGTIYAMAAGASAASCLSDSWNSSGRLLSSASLTVSFYE